MLSDRRQRVLAALIEEYVSHALPVGSRTLVERYNLGVSSATVRNELSALEGEGYIAQPHTSAGRIPTDAGYRSFVDDLLENELTDERLDEETSKAVERLRQSASELDELENRTTEALSRLTHCLSIVLPPSALSLNVRQITFVSFSAHRVLVVVITEDGQVLNRQVDFAHEVSADDLAAAQTLLNRLLAGKCLGQIRAEFDDEAAAVLADPVVRTLCDEVFACLEDGDGSRGHRLGLSTLVRQPEFAQAEVLMPVLEVLEDDTVLLQILHPDSPDKTTVRIGHENRSSQLSGVSVVAGRYGRGAGEGVVAIIGPTRMDYAQVIRAVHAARAALGE
ncbi:heat-inducible transcriptional repressor HrcA [Curtanaerobium respiraculi]|uniref:heat-inducible transcriptional repressor HrcA n=1 Tax=Curtanaerobium respiraculi TaxID=2949669 RepID=UPI0024B32895|nr:heat-inducible transcriptional repressor HrcA [Curtanaerobium respiraculi]